MIILGLLLIVIGVILAFSQTTWVAMLGPVLSCVGGFMAGNGVINHIMLG